MHLPALLTAPRLHSHPVYNLRICHRHVGNTLSVCTETIFKDTTIACSSAQRIFPASYSLGPCRATWFSLGLPIMSKGTEQMTQSAWYSLYIGLLKLHPKGKEAQHLSTSETQYMSAYAPRMVNGKPLPQASQLGFPLFMFSVSSLAPESLMHS